MLEFTLNFRDRLHALAPVLVAAAALLACALLQGCFSSEGVDSPYTIPAGEEFETLEMEVEPDGTVLLVVRVAMYYGHNDSTQADFTSPQMRNKHTIVYRRSAGVWSATPFKNLQMQVIAFPAFVPAADGRFHLFVWDGGTVFPYYFRDGRWYHRQALEDPRRFDLSHSMGGRNWQRHPWIAIPDDSTLLFVRYTEEYHSRIESSPARKAVKLSSQFIGPEAFHVAPGFQAVAGREPSERGLPDRGESLTYFHWRPGEDSATKAQFRFLETIREVFFSPYRDGTGLFVAIDGFVYIIPLAPDGSPGLMTSHALPESLEAVGNLFAADAGGCIHGIRSVGAKSPSGATLPPRKFLHWNTCLAPEDTLDIGEPPAGKSHYVYPMRFRMGPAGRPMAALVLHENPGAGPVKPGYSINPSQLIFAEWNGDWTLQVVDSR